MQTTAELFDLLNNNKSFLQWKNNIRQSFIYSPSHFISIIPQVILSQKDLQDNTYKY